MMRKLVLAVALLLVARTAPAQEQYLELARQDLKTQKVALVTEAMELTEAQSEPFWKVYRDYDYELTKLGDERLALIKEYANTYTTMTDEKANELATGAMKADMDRLKLREKYYGVMAEQLSPTVATRWMQVERQIATLTDLQIAAQMPLIRKAETPPPEANP